jgi:hypothetical protein
MGETSRTIIIAEQDGSTVRIVGHGPKGSIEVIAEMVIEGDALVLRGLHADGSGPGSLGLGEIKAFAQQFGRQMGVSVVRIYGGIRTTGAFPGKVPRPVLIRVSG